MRGEIFLCRGRVLSTDLHVSVNEISLIQSGVVQSARVQQNVICGDSEIREEMAVNVVWVVTKCPLTAPLLSALECKSRCVLSTSVFSGA